MNTILHTKKDGQETLEEPNKDNNLETEDREHQELEWVQVDNNSRKMTHART